MAVNPLEVFWHVVNHHLRLLLTRDIPLRGPGQQSEGIARLAASRFLKRSHEPELLFEPTTRKDRRPTESLILLPGLLMKLQ
jgi:hypothetical protein